MSSPEAIQDKDTRSCNSKSPEQHPSVMAIREPNDESRDADPPAEQSGSAATSDKSTPVSHNSNKTTSPRNIVTKCKSLFGINNSPTKDNPPAKVVDCDLLYSMLITLEMRVFKLEEENIQLKEAKQEEVEQLKLQLGQKEEELTLMRNPQVSEIPDNEFITHMKREFPLLSQACGTNEEALNKIKEDIIKLSSDSDSLSTKLEQDVNTLNTKIANLNSGLAVAGMGGDTVNEQEGQVNVAAMDNELRRVGGEVSNIKNSARKQRRMDHLAGDKRDQYSRRENLRVTGVPFRQGENTNQIMIQIACSLGVHITDGDISVSHRSGRRVGGSPRPILCKFIRRDTKNQILANKMLARHIRTDPEGNAVKIYVDEDLTSMRARVCKKLRQDRVPHYSRDGKVYIASADSESQYKVHDTPEDWEQLQWSDAVKTDIGIYPQD